MGQPHIHEIARSNYGQSLAPLVSLPQLRRLLFGVFLLVSRADETIGLRERHFDEAVMALLERLWLDGKSLEVLDIAVPKVYWYLFQRDCGS